jgi:predicted dehydrogenase
MAHLGSHLALGRSEVVALCDRNPERLKAAAAKCPGARTYEDDGIFSDPDVEAISIHTGDPFHRDPFIKAVQAGKHVLIEKPLANTEQDVLDMARAYDRAVPGLKVQVGYILRFNPVYEELHRMARNGQLGDLYYMEGDYVHNLLYQAKQTDAVTGRNWYLEHEIPLVGGGSHPLDILRWVSGKEIVRTRAYSTRVAFPAMAADDCQVALFQFEDGSIAKVAALYGPRCGCPPFYNIRFYGTKGTVERDQAALSKSEEDVHPAFGPILAGRVHGHPYEPEIVDWLDAIQENRQPRVPLHDAANSTLATLCAARAAVEKREVEVPVLRPGGCKCAS